MGVNDLGNPPRSMFTGDQEHDITRGYGKACGLVNGIKSEYVIDNRGYDLRQILKRILERIS